jgi:membrane protease subunit HflC
MTGDAQGAIHVPKGLTILAGVLFVVVLLLSAVTYTVRFTEAAVLTTFGKAGEGAIKDQPGLKWKLPYPIQSVTKYDTRLQWVQTRSQTQVTKDQSQIVVEGFCTWRVKDPLKFFQRYSNAGPSASDHYRKAEENVRSSLQAALSVVGSFRMNEMFSQTPGSSRLPELEKKILESMSGAASGGVSAADYGIEIVDVGLSRVILPEATTKVVLERMMENRKRLVKEIESKGEAEAVRVKSTAEAMAKKISAFASQRAETIRATGDLESRPYYEKMNSNPELAVFLKNVELITLLQSKRTTLVTSTGMPGMGLLNPGAMNQLKPGEIPSANLPELEKNGREKANQGNAGGGQ